MDGGARAGRRFGHAEVFAAVGLLSLLVARFAPVLSTGFVCPLRALAGIPCATCGMTRAFVALARGEPGAAWAASPLGALLAAVTWLLALADVVRLAVNAPLPAPGPRLARAAAAAGVVALLANWAWLVAREVSP
jgi:Protein of unknown function (DUF2752)